MKRLIVLLSLGAVATLCPAQTRWCSSVGGSSSTYYFYPAMARMEKIQGVVIGRITILPTGKVQSVEIVSGPPQLAKALHDQLLKWKLHNETDNDESSCQTLVIADFRISSPYGKNLLDEPKPAPPGVMRLLVEADTPSDPGLDQASNGTGTHPAPPDNLRSSSTP